MYVYALVLGNTLLMLHFHNIRVIGQSLPEVAGVIDIADGKPGVFLYPGAVLLRCLVTVRQPGKIGLVHVQPHQKVFPLDKRSDTKNRKDVNIFKEFS